MRVRDYAPRPVHIMGFPDSDSAIRWLVMRDLTEEDSNAVGAEGSRMANEGWRSRLLSRQSRAGNWAEPDEDRGLLIPFYSLVVLMDIGLDHAGKQARKMIERIEKQFVLRRLNDRPFLRGETEPCVNGRILALDAYFQKPNHALGTPPSAGTAQRCRLELRGS